MSPFHALLHAMRTRRTRRIDLDEADRLATGAPPGLTQPGLGTLLDALRAPATADELGAEKAAIAAFRTHRKRAARAARRKTPTRAVLVPALTALALLMFGGTALAARTGNLPVGAQQHAHRLFSALGVPAPRTGPRPGSSTSPSPSSPASPVVELGWCADWQPGGPSLNSDDHRKLQAAAGSEGRIPGYCDSLRRSASPSPSPSRSPSRTPVATPTPSVPPSSPSPTPTESSSATTPSDRGSLSPSPSRK